MSQNVPNFTLYQRLFDLCENGLFLLSKEFVVLQANKRAGKLLAIPPEKMIGEPLSRWVLGEAGRLSDHAEKEWFPVRLNGEKAARYWASWHSFGNDSGTVFLFQLVSSDVFTLPDRYSKELQRKMENLQDILSLSRQLLSTSDLEQVLQTILKLIADRLDSNSCAISLLSEDGKGLRLVAQRASEIAFRLGEIGEAIPFKILEISFRAVQQRQPVYIPDIRTEPNLSKHIRDFHKSVGLVSILDVPMIGPEGVLGILHVNQYTFGRRYRPDEIEFAQTLANQAAIAVLNARLYANQRAAYEQLEQTQNRLLEAERLSALGELSAAIAHEIRNPLGAISNSISVLRRDMEFPGVYNELIEIVSKETERIKKITDDFLLFARPRKPIFEEINLSELIRSEISVLLKDTERFKNISFEISPETSVFLFADRQQLLEVFENLFLNAAVAMNNGGKIWVRLNENTQGGTILVEIEDNGSGIPAHVLPHIFKPFYSTRSSGTGLGLSIVKRIVDEHRGKINVISRPGQGTRVRLFLRRNQN